MIKKGRGPVQRVQKSLQVTGDERNPVQESVTSSAMDCCRSEDSLALPIVNTDARESSDILYQSLVPPAFVIYLFHADFYVTEVAFKPYKPDFRSYSPIPSSSTTH